MIMEPVSSSNIAAVGYEAEEKILRVEFLNGTSYEYTDVPEAEYTDLLNADSVGKQFNQCVKNNYAYTQV